MKLYKQKHKLKIMNLKFKYNNIENYSILLEL